MKKSKLGNPPFSPYHHKTEAPGMPGHHRLNEIKNTCLSPAEDIKVHMMIEEMRSQAYNAGANGDDQAYRDTRLIQAEISRMIGRCRCQTSKSKKR